MLPSNERKMEGRLGFIAEMPAPAGEVPVEFQVFPRGRVEIEGSAGFSVDEEAMEAVIRRFRSRGLDMVVDYEHQTEKDTEAPAAGWIRELFSRGEEGLWAKVEWTERARQYLANREYRYYSPVFSVSGVERKLVELLRVALDQRSPAQLDQAHRGKGGSINQGGGNGVSRVVCEKTGAPGRGE